MYSKIIKRIRNKLLLNQTECAKKLGVSLMTLQRWEQGNFTPSFENRKKILKFCKQNNINIEDIENKYED